MMDKMEATRQNLEEKVENLCSIERKILYNMCSQVEHKRANYRTEKVSNETNNCIVWKLNVIK